MKRLTTLSTLPLLVVLATMGTTQIGMACPPRVNYGYRPVYQPVYQTYQPTYQQPVYYTTPAVTVTTSTPTLDVARRLQDHVAVAKTEYAAKNYGLALARLNAALELAPNQTDILQFRSLVQLALGQHKPASASLYAALSRGDMWTLAEIQRVNPVLDDYRSMVDSLAMLASAKPETPEVHFLLAYHHQVLGRMVEARAELQRAQTLMPSDPLVAKWLATLPAASVTASN